MKSIVNGNKVIDYKVQTLTKSVSIQPHFYDGDGLRVSRTDNLSLPPKTTYYVWDTENPTDYPQVIEEIEGGQVVRRYGYGLFLETIDIKNGTEFERFYVVRDGTNSVRMLLDSTGNVSATYDYDAFGNILNSSNANPLTSQNPYQFHSEYRDPTTGLVYLRARWYQPKDGRFIGMDKYEGGNYEPKTLNKYIFAGDNPFDFQDPSGNEFISVMFAGNYSVMSAIMLYQPKVLFEAEPGSLSDEETDEGIIERLFISEIRNPYSNYVISSKNKVVMQYFEPLAVQSMRLLGALIRNRMNSTYFPNTVSEVIKDNKPVEQFKGFSTYPTLPAGILSRINGVINVVNDKLNVYNFAMKRFLKSVKNIASQTATGYVSDPYNGKTMFMRTANSGKPTKNAKELITIMDNTFYSEK